MKITFFLMKKFSLYFQELEKNNNKNCVLLRTIFLFEVWKTQKNWINFKDEKSENRNNN
jgi:hypothetical protein